MNERRQFRWDLIIASIIFSAALLFLAMILRANGSAQGIVFEDAIWSFEPSTGVAVRLRACPHSITEQTISCDGGGHPINLQGQIINRIGKPIE